MLFNRTSAKLSLTSWVEEVPPKDPVLFTLIGCPSVDSLPPLDSYFDFMNRFWNKPREQYARSSLLPKGKNGKKSKKELGADGKLVEPEPNKYATKNLAESILNRAALSNSYQDILQDIFYLAAVLPSFKNGLISKESLTVSRDGAAVAVHATPFGRKPQASEKSRIRQRHAPLL